jgi:hypothetical protein
MTARSATRIVVNLTHLESDIVSAAGVSRDAFARLRHVVYGLIEQRGQWLVIWVPIVVTRTALADDDVPGRIAAPGHAELPAPISTNCVRDMVIVVVVRTRELFATSFARSSLTV